MSAILGYGGWGSGLLWSAPGEGVRGSALEGVSDRTVEDLSVRQLIDDLNVADADFNPHEIHKTMSFPGPVAEAFYWSDADVVGIQGPVGSGKTTTFMKSRLRRAVEAPPSVIDGVRRYKVLFLRETYRQVWSTTIPSYLEVFPKSWGIWAGGRGDPVTHKIRFDDGFGPIEFTAEFMAFGDDIVASMRGIQTTDIALNEADTMPVDILTVGIGRIDRFPSREHFSGLPLAAQTYGQIAGDFNAPDEENWTFEVFHDEEKRRKMADALSAELPEGAKRIEIAFFNQPGYGEPGAENLQNLSANYYPRQIASMTMAGRGDMLDRLVYNKVGYIRAGEPVWKREFNRRIHVADKPLEIYPDKPLLIGLDQGFKGAAVICQEGPRNYLRVLAEMFYPKERLMAAVFGTRLRMLLNDRFPGLRVGGGWADMAGEHGASEAADENDTWNRLVARSANIVMRAQRIGTNRIQPRLEAVRSLLEAPLIGGEPGLLIDPGCKFLIAGFEARYVWTEVINNSGDKRKIPDKSLPEANVMDALQYLALRQVRGDGTSELSFPDQMGHNGGPPFDGPPSGLVVGHDILNPYGG